MELCRIVSSSEGRKGSEYSTISVFKSMMIKCGKLKSMDNRSLPNSVDGCNFQIISGM
jgi:hypothetical protein